MPSILIVDQDEKFLSSLTDDKLSTVYPIISSDTASRAQVLLAENRTIVATFINVSISEHKSGPDAYSVVRFCKTVRPEVPVFLMDETRQTTLSRELKKMGVSGVLDKNVNYTTLVSLAGLNALSFDKERALALAKQNFDQIDQETAANDEHFFPIRALEFVSGSTVMFDLYVRIRLGQYIKILRAGDQFSSDRLKSYLEKGLTHFHIRNAAREHYLAYTGKLAGKIVTSDKINSEIKTLQVLNFGEETLKFLSDRGLNETRIQYAAAYVEDVRKLVKSLPYQKSDAMLKFMSNLATFEHGVSVSMIAGLIAKELQIQSEASVQIVGLASLLHDVGLVSMPAHFQNEETSQMNPKELIEFNKHPEIGYQILSEIRGLHPSVLQSVLQHHQRKNKKGFSFNTKIMSKVSEIIGISDDFIRLIKQNLQSNNSTDTNPFQAIKREFPGFSSSVVEAFQRTFIEQHPIKK